MVSFVVRMEFQEADRERVKEILCALTAATRLEPGCVSYVPHLTKEGPAAIVLYEQYVDEAALECHRNSPHFAQYAKEGLYKLITGRQLEFLDAIA